jgi:hypothetical protein
MTLPAPPKIVQVGKRPIIDYVTKDYEGFKQGMLGLIPQLLPNWTDRTENDFGVVLIELFAYVADILSYYQDRVANEAYLSTATQRRSVVELLRLIDYMVDPGLAASALVHIDVTADVDVTALAPPGALPYRVKTTGIPGQDDRIFEVTQPFSLRLLNNAITITGPTLTAGISSVTVAKNSHALGRGDIVYLEETTQQKIRRSPPLQVTAVTPGATTDTVQWQPQLTEDYVLASTVLKGNNVAATHGQTITNEASYRGDGTPSQQLTLSRPSVTYLLAPQAPQRQRRSRPELEVRVDGVLWDLVDSFVNSGPFDTHYTVTIDENDYLTVHFGTGQRGAVVSTGATVTVQYRVGLGRGGNVGPDTITVPVTTVPQVKGVSNPFAAEGGADRETTDEAKISGPGSIISQERAVTLQDYELLAKGFPGVGKAKARVGVRGGYKVVQVFVVPQDTGVIPPQLPAADLKEALRQELESRQPVNRMAGVDVFDPTFVAINITVDVHVKAEASASGINASVLTALQDLLSFDQVDFGSAIRVGDIYATLYPIAGISYVQLRSLTRGDQPPPTASSVATLVDVSIAENEMPYAGQLKIATIGGGP